MTTKLAFWIAVIVPGGFFILAALVLLRSVWRHARTVETTAARACR